MAESVQIENKTPEIRRRRGNPNWVRGVSGNPGGRPREFSQVIELARDEQPRNFATLIAIRDDPKAPPAVRADCAWKLHTVGYGKPTETLKLEALQPVEVPTITITSLISPAAGHGDATHVVRVLPADSTHQEGG